MTETVQGILLVNKDKDMTSFDLVPILRRKLGVKKIGHAGTLDPLATGLMVMLVGREYTRRSQEFMGFDKEYKAVIELGASTSTLDKEGEVVASSDYEPTLDELKEVLDQMTGPQQQIPPMHSAKKVGGQKLYKLARKGKEVERQPISVEIYPELISYAYPLIEVNIRCSKGTYIRTYAQDVAKKLNCEGHLADLCRTRIGPFMLDQAIDTCHLKDSHAKIEHRLKKI